MSNDDIAHVFGSPAPDVKKIVVNPLLFPGITPTSGKAKGFGCSIAARLVITEVSIEKKAEEPQKQEGRVVCELPVEAGVFSGY
jgi:acyl-coenzyme A thioesterase 13